MERVEYINELTLSLKGIPSQDLADIIEDIQEHFDVGVSKGKTELEISKELGNPKEVARNYISSFEQYPKDEFNQDLSSDNKDTTRKVLVIIALFFFNILVVLAPFMLVWGLLLSFYAMSLGFFFSGLGILIGFPLTLIYTIINPHFLTRLGFGLGFVALGLLCLIAAVFLTIKLGKLTWLYIKWNISLL